MFAIPSSIHGKEQEKCSTDQYSIAATARVPLHIEQLQAGTSPSLITMRHDV
jgi:hypothetical protein